MLKCVYLLYTALLFQPGLNVNTWMLGGCEIYIVIICELQNPWMIWHIGSRTMFSNPNCACIRENLGQLSYKSYQITKLYLWSVLNYFKSILQFLIFQKFSSFNLYDNICYWLVFCLFLTPMSSTWAILAMIYNSIYILAWIARNSLKLKWVEKTKGFRNHRNSLKISLRIMMRILVSNYQCGILTNVIPKSAQEWFLSHVGYSRRWTSRPSSMESF